MAPHRPRPALAARFPLFATLALARGLPDLRDDRIHASLRAALAAGRARPGFRLVHYSIQSDHLHLLVEARGRAALSRGMTGLSVRLARSLNRHLGRRGQVFADRFRGRTLRTPREVRAALCRLLLDARRHGEALAGGPDPFTSGCWFDGWKKTVAAPQIEGEEQPVTPPRTRLLRSAWRRCGLLAFDEVPAAI